MADQLKAALIKRQEVEKLTQLSRSSLYAKLNPKDVNHDPSFPVPVRVSSTAVRWVAYEVEAWIASRPRTRISANDAQFGHSADAA